MNSEFQHIALDRIRYALVWEDYKTLYSELDIHPDDHVMIITSAGCNVLNALLKKPASVTAVDLNPYQNKLLSLKLHVIQHHDYFTFRSIMGFDGQAEAEKAWQLIQHSLSIEGKNIWMPFFTLYPKGILASGKLENYITDFHKTLPDSIQQKLRVLSKLGDVKVQYEYFIDELHHSEFTDLFIEYFDEVNLSKGRDPRLFKYSQDSVGLTFYKRFMSFLSKFLVKENFFFQFFLFGAEGLPENVLPPCYQSSNYDLLKQEAHKVSIKNGEVIEFLLSSEASEISKVSLSNIFEYTDAEEFDKVCTSLYSKKIGAPRIIFWNLLQDQGGEMPLAFSSFLKVKDIPANKESCFYFQNVKVLESISVQLPILTT